MRYNLDEILRITYDLVVSIRVADDITREYEWIQQAWIPPQPGSVSSSLYFASYMEGKDGWHTPFDRRSTVREVLLQNPGWHGVVEEGIKSPESQHLVVSSLKEFSRRIYWDARARTRPIVIGVTGSVGKTTTVAFLEHLLRCAGLRVLRFWSKRLTPFLIETHYVNRVLPQTDAIVLEYSAFKPHHVGRLAGHLPPDLSFFTNLYDQHIRADLFASREEVFHSKLRIKPVHRPGFINQEILSAMNGPLPEGWRPFVVDVDSQLISLNPLLPPTKRTSEMCTVGLLVARHFGISDATVDTAVRTFQPQEGRLVRCAFSSGSVFFDSEAPHGPRLWSWFETVDGSVPSLLVESITFGNDDVSTYLNLIEQVFESVDTFVLDNEANRANLPVRATFVNAERFRSLLIERMTMGAYVVYHKTVKGTIPHFNHREHLINLWGMDTT